MYGQVVSAGPVVAVHPPGGRPAEQGGALPLRLPGPLLSATLIQDRHTVRQAGEHARQKVSEIIVCPSVYVCLFGRICLPVCLSICQTKSTINLFFFSPPSRGCLTARLSAFLV